MLAPVTNTSADNKVTSLNETKLQWAPCQFQQAGCGRVVSSCWRTVTRRRAFGDIIDVEVIHLPAVQVQAQRDLAFIDAISGCDRVCKCRYCHDAAG